MSSSISDTETSLSMKSLREIATNVCIRQIHKIDDVGDIPYRLLRPILRRMNAKQLTRIEEFSTQVTPDSDEMWRDLIVKEFPNRPPDPVATSRDEYMPYKSLFYQYWEERDALRNDSAARLRSINERLKKEKSANSIVAVTHMVRDPSVRKRSGYFQGSSSGYASIPGNKSSILYKARKELQHRQLMFPKKAGGIRPRRSFPTAMRKMGVPDPAQTRMPMVPYPSVAPRPRNNDSDVARSFRPMSLTRPRAENTEPPKIQYNEKPVLTITQEREKSTTIERSMLVEKGKTAEKHTENTLVNDLGDAPTTSTEQNQVTQTGATDNGNLPKRIPAPRKRRPEASIFLTKRRQIAPIPRPAPKKEPMPPQQSSASPIKKIKSSIFS